MPVRTLPRGVWEYEGETPGPRVGIVGSLHGDEPCGTRALARLREEFAAGRRLHRGTLVLIEGNPDALEVGLRHTEGGSDLNRLFDMRFRRHLPRAQWGAEHRRALELAPVLDGLEAGLDLHSATSPTPPFGIAIGAVAQRNPNDGAASLHLGLKLGLNHLTYGWERCSDVGAEVAMARVRGPAIAVECGQHGQGEADAKAWEVANRYLAALGMSDFDGPGSPECPIWSVEFSFDRPNASFRFSHALRGFEAMPEGGLIGEGGGETMRVPPGRWTALLPNDGVEVGKTMLFLARRDDDALRYLT